MFGLEYNELINLISFWGYPLMFLLMVVEGPIVTMTASFLASLDIFNWFNVFLLSMLGDLMGDIILYALGFFGGHKTLEKLERALKIKEGVVEKLEDGFEKHGSRIIFSVKTTTGLSWITFVLAGAVRMSFKKFLLFSFLGGIIWSGLLVGLGYFFGYAAEQIERYIKFAGWGIFAGALVVMFYIMVMRKRRAKKIFKNTKEFGKKLVDQGKKKINDYKNNISE